MGVCVRVLCCEHVIGHYAIRSLLEEIEPAAHPRSCRGRGEHLLDAAGAPVEQLDLIGRQRLEAHVASADQECVQVGHDRAHAVLQTQEPREPSAASCEAGAGSAEV
jgi:hypothetical protein